MRIFRDSDSGMQPAPAASFTGFVQMKALAQSEADTPVHLYRVAFGPGGRTNWHTHSGPQWLFVVEGRIRIQTHGGRVEELAPGDAVVFAPGEKHWHGSSPREAGVHLAINVDAKTEWKEPVSDLEFGA